MKQAYLRIYLFILILLAPAFVFSQGFGLPAGFELKKFQANEDQALYFLQYDSAYQRVATYDHISGQKDFICYQEKRGWKVVVGTVDSSGFKKDANYYQVDAKGIVTLSKKKFDTIQVAAMGRALYNSNVALAKLNIHTSSWRKFSKINLDGTVIIWAFPDADAAGNIWYGPECSWYYSPDGRRQTTNKIVNKTPMMAGKSGPVLNLSCPTEKMPTIGLIWLAHRYKLDYSEINISYKTGTSTLKYNKEEKTWAWDHAAN
jgi:hypothetical protein